MVVPDIYRVELRNRKVNLVTVNEITPFVLGFFVVYKTILIFRCLMLLSKPYTSRY